MNYVQLIPAGAEPKGGRIRKGITGSPELIQQLARKKYLQQALFMLEQNIPALEGLVKIHRVPTADNILKNLPQAYRELPARSFLPEQRRKDAWAEEPYDQSTYKPEERIHTTARGLRVRSKSEVIIADRLDARRIESEITLKLL